MALFRENILDMSGYVPGFQPRETGFVKLNTNENPYPPSPRVKEALDAVAQADLRKYPDPFCEPFRQVAGRILGIAPGRILAGFGSDDILRMIFMACVAPGDMIAYPYPTYSLYKSLAEMSDARILSADFPEDYSLPEELIGNNARVTLIANPNSPSGTMIPAARLAELAGSLKGILVIDEAYVDFADENCLPLIERFGNVIVCRTLSKSYSLAGIRFGFAVAQEPVIEQLVKVKDSYNTDRLSQAAAVAAFSDQEWMRLNAERIREQRAVLAAGLEALGFSVWPSQSNFVLARTPSGASAPRLLELLMERKVLIRYFAQRRVDDCLRITVGAPEEVRRLLDCLGELLERTAERKT
ncbi:MAG TPA: histidinol-phosphate transaminase [Candidatus Brocadiia bacterium]|nr:histidinol-phosphate transaminase [Candidatus Brocadiia bacterium]